MEGCIDDATQRGGDSILRKFWASDDEVKVNLERVRSPDSCQRPSMTERVFMRVQVRNNL
jgi:hypothetical protein